MNICCEAVLNLKPKGIKGLHFVLNFSRKLFKILLVFRKIFIYIYSEVLKWVVWEIKLAYQIRKTSPAKTGHFN